MDPDEPSKLPKFPHLPIITVDQPKLTQREKYGGLFYLGIAGLIVVAALVSWFAWSAWTLRGVWSNVYVLHDASRTEDERIQAAYTLSRDVGVDAQQRWDMALRKPLPPLARYLIAESWTTETVKADPLVFAKIVAFSDGWPDWLRLLGVRLMAVSSAEGIHFPADVLSHLAEQSNPSFQAWVDYIRAVSTEEDREALARLKTLSRSKAPTAGLAEDLAASIDGRSLERTRGLEAATRWMRTNDPEASKIWQGWVERDGQLIRTRP